MVDDLKIIKKHYGEKMSHLCRELFPTLLEEPGWLSNFMLEKFEPNKLLYEDIIMNGFKESFKNFVLSFKQIKREEVPVTKTPSELLSVKNYDYKLKHEEKTYNKNIEFYSKTKPQKGDYIYISRNTLEEDMLTYGHIHNIDDLNHNNVLVIEKNEKRVYLLRYYG